MKKIILFTLASTLALAASAQSWQDALLFSENEYAGTARSVAMGNALTAVGGDLGSIGLNPAGSAVAGYSQFTLSPGLSLAVANVSGSQPELGFGNRVSTTSSRPKMPNLGVVIAMNTGHRSGLKRVSFGFVSNATNDYTSRMYAGGVNVDNSFSGAVASSAAGYPQDVLSGESTNIGWWNLDEFNETYGLSWRDMVAYRSGIIGTVNGRYLGLTDWDKDGVHSGVLAPLYQEYGYQTKGYKHDMLFNLAFNFSDELYLGANFGLVTLRYGQAEFWQEMPNNDSEFPAIPFDTNPNARFRSLEMKRIFEARGTGVNFKVGVLWRPSGVPLRLGAALQTPTALNINTRMAYYGQANVTGVNLPSSQSPEYEDAYALISPWRFNMGVAYTFGDKALVSADYEVVNYGRSRLRSQTASYIYYSSNYFDDANADIKDVLGASHMLRLGVEVNPIPGLAVRAGYGLATSGQHNYLDWEYDPADGKSHLMVYKLSARERAALCRHMVSAGAGYNYGPYFADLAVRFKTLPTQYFKPYEYLGYDNDYTDKYVVDEAPYTVPEVVARYRRWDVILTLGMRF